MRRMSIRGRGVAVSAAVVLAVACGGDASDGPAGTSASPDAGADWGPLAVVAAPEGGDDALISGTLEIDDRCVLLDEGGGAVLLVWPSATTTWDSSTSAVSIATPDGQRVALEDGDTATFSGGGSSVAEGGSSVEEFLASTEWVQAPSPGCVTDTRWFVTNLTST